MRFIGSPAIYLCTRHTAGAPRALLPPAAPNPVPPPNPQRRSSLPWRRRLRPLLRQKLWKDIGALGADSELASSVAVVTGSLSQVAAPRDVVGAIPDAQRLVLLRLLLDGYLKDAMPDGYMSVHETPLWPCTGSHPHA